MARKGTLREGTDISSSGDSLEETTTEPQCPICKGAGFVYPDVLPNHPDFGIAVPCKCQLKKFEDERLSRLQRYSNLGPLVRLTLDNLITRGRSSDPENQERFSRTVLAAKAFAQNPDGWLVLMGVSGCGKTHLAAAIANYRLAQGHPALFIVVPDLLDHLRSTFGPNSEISYDELFQQVRDAPLLILDDLGTQSSTPWAKEKLYQIINHRFNAQLPMVVTTNITLDELDERLRTRLTDPTLSRICVVEERVVPIFQQTGTLGLGLRNEMNFENFDWKGLHLPPEKRHSLEHSFRNALNFAQSPEGWLVFLGPTGCGKTHLAAAIANYRLRAGESVYFAEMLDLLDQLRSSFSLESKLTYDQLFEKIKSTPLLILEDLETQSITPWAQAKLYQLLNYRYNARLPTVITSSFSLDDIEDRLASRMGDPKLSTVIGIEASDFRIDRKPSKKTEATTRRGRKHR